MWTGRRDARERARQGRDVEQNWNRVEQSLGLEGGRGGTAERARHDIALRKNRTVYSWSLGLFKNWSSRAQLNTRLSSLASGVCRMKISAFIGGGLPLWNTKTCLVGECVYVRAHEYAIFCHRAQPLLNNYSGTEG